MNQPPFTLCAVPSLAGVRVDTRGCHYRICWDEEWLLPVGEVIVHLEEGGLGRAGHANFLGDRADLFLPELLERLSVAPHVGDADTLAALVTQWKMQPGAPFPPLVKPIFWMTWSYWSGVAPLKSSCTPIAILSSFGPCVMSFSEGYTLKQTQASRTHIHGDFEPIRPI